MGKPRVKEIGMQRVRGTLRVKEISRQKMRGKSMVRVRMMGMWRGQPRVLVTWYVEGLESMVLSASVNITH